MVRSADGRGPDTKLLPLIKDRLDINDIDEIMQRIYMNDSRNGTMNKKEIASLAPIVTRAASNGDKVASNIIKNGAKELTLMVQVVANKLGFTSGEVPLVTTGGAVNGSPLFKNELHKSILDGISECKIYEPQLSPVWGSALLALQMLDIDSSQEIVKNMNVTMPEYHT